MASLVEELKRTACSAIDSCASELEGISSDIWNHPELGHEERHAHSVLTAFLEKHGFQVYYNYIMYTFHCKPNNATNAVAVYIENNVCLHDYHTRTKTISTKKQTSSKNMFKTLII